MSISGAASSTSWPRSVQSCAVCLAAALASLYKYNAGGLLSNERIPVQVILDTLEKNPVIRQSLNAQNISTTQKGVALKQIVRGSNVVYLHYIFSKIDRRLATNFFATVASGEYVNGKRTSINTLREMLLKFKLDAHKGMVRIRSGYESVLIIKTWNSFIQGRVLNTIMTNLEKDKDIQISNNVIIDYKD